MRMLMTLVFVLVLAGSAFGQGSTVADFEGTNNGDWTFSSAGEILESAGGNPDGWLHNPFRLTFAPIFVCDWDAYGFTGNYVLSGVNRIAADFQTLSSTQQYIGQFPMTVMLRNHMGTPGDIEDDVFVYFNPDLNFAPDIGTGWNSYSWDIPWNFDGAPGELPADWMGGSYYTGNATFPSDVTWQDVLSDVGRVEFWWFHPDWSAIFAEFDIGADNVVVEWEGGTVPAEDSTWGDVKAMFR